MSVESLPYTLLILLAQFSAGSAIAVIYVQARGCFEPAFVRICSWLTFSAAALTTLTALAIAPENNLDAYPLDPDLLDPVRALAMATLLFSAVFVFFLRRDDEAFLANATGATTAGLGVVMLTLLASLVRVPTWSIVGPALTFYAGALTLGFSSVAMVWGHWYLVNPRLEEGPLNELTLLTTAIIGAELVVTAINAIIPVGTPVESEALLAVDLPQNPGFWLRVGVGIVFPLILSYLAYRSSRERSMMSATGLLYIAVGAILAGEAVGRGLLFVTGAAV